MHTPQEDLGRRVTGLEVTVAGQAKAIDKLEARAEKTEQRVEGIEQQVSKAKWLIFGAVLAAGVLTGSGRISLESLLKYLGL